MLLWCLSSEYGVHCIFLMINVIHYHLYNMYIFWTICIFKINNNIKIKKMKDVITDAQRAVDFYRED